MRKLVSIARWMWERLMRFVHRLKSMFPLLPIIGPLADCTLRAHGAAFKEFALSFIFSTSTFWATVATLRVVPAYRGTPLSDLVSMSFASGGLLIFCVGFVGSIIMTVAEDPGKAKIFPGRAWHIVIVVVIGLLAALYAGLIKISEIYPDSKIINTLAIIHISVWMAFVVSALRYLALVYRHQTFSPGDEIKGRENNFTRGFLRRQGRGA